LQQTNIDKFGDALKAEYETDDIESALAHLQRDGCFSGLAALKIYADLMCRTVLHAQINFSPLRCTFVDIAVISIRLLYSFRVVAVGTRRYQTASVRAIPHHGRD